MDKEAALEAFSEGLGCKRASLGSFLASAGRDMTYGPFFDAARNAGGVATSLAKGDLRGDGRHFLGFGGNALMAGLNTAAFVGAPLTGGGTLAARAGLSAARGGLRSALRSGAVRSTLRTAKSTAGTLKSRALASVRAAMSRLPAPLQTGVRSVGQGALAIGKQFLGLPVGAGSLVHVNKALAPLAPLLSRVPGGRAIGAAGRLINRAGNRVAKWLHNSNSLGARVLMNRHYSPDRVWANRGITAAHYGGAVLAPVAAASASASNPQPVIKATPEELRMRLMSSGLKPTPSQAQALARHFGVPASTFLW